jgi:hypothetical protein
MENITFQLKHVFVACAYGGKNKFTRTHSKNSILGTKMQEAADVNDISTLIFWDTKWCSLLRHCTTSQKAMGLIPDGVVIDLNLLATQWPWG